MSVDKIVISKEGAESGISHGTGCGVGTGMGITNEGVGA